MKIPVTKIGFSVIVEQKSVHSSFFENLLENELIIMIFFHENVERKYKI